MAAAGGELICHVWQSCMEEEDASNTSTTLLPLAAFPRITEIGKKAWLFAKLQPGKARNRINAT